MKQANGATHSSYLSAVIDAVRVVLPDAEGIDASTPLAGSGAVLDSVGLVGLLFTLEQAIPKLDLASSLMEGAEQPVEEGPFRTAGSLADHIHNLLNR
jgi:hypothetical protein